MATTVLHQASLVIEEVHIRVHQNLGFSNPPSQNFLLFILVIIDIKTKKTGKLQVRTPSRSRITAPLKMGQTPPIKFDILHKWP